MTKKFWSNTRKQNISSAIFVIKRYKYQHPVIDPVNMYNEIIYFQLYTAPGLSIHCMQVHKEAIDKVPNSLPNRSNIEIEIYGMEGIPPADLRDHEKNKNGNKSESDEDEPSAKKNKLEPVTMVPQMMIPNMMAQNAMGQFQMMAAMNPYMPVQMIPHMMGGPRPLFPSAVSAASSVPFGNMKPTFPAYSNATISAPPTTNLGQQQQQLQTSTSTNISEMTPKPSVIPHPTGTASKIMHPPEDISLEEIRCRKAQYRVNKNPTVSSPQSSASSNPSVSSNKYNETKMVAAAQEVSNCVYDFCCYFKFVFWIFIS